MGKVATRQGRAERAFGRHFAQAFQIGLAARLGAFDNAGCDSGNAWIDSHGWHPSIQIVTGLMAPDDA